jgi:hypothetical protein
MHMPFGNEGQIKRKNVDGHMINNDYIFLFMGVNNDDNLSSVVSPLGRCNLLGINVQMFNLILTSESLIVFLL